MSRFNKTITMSLALMSFVMTACHKETENTTIKTDVQQFDAVWNELNDTYVFWSVDTTDWDAIYTKYHPIFEEMENEPDSVWEATWRELTSTLLDHHLEVKLVRPSTNDSITLRPGAVEIKGRYYWHKYALFFDIDPSYSSEEDLFEILLYAMNGWPTSQSGMLDIMVMNNRLLDTVKWKDDGGNLLYSGILDQEIAYLYVSSFKLLMDKTPAFRHFKQLVAKENIKAAIIDVRDNMGGASENLVPMLSCFTTESMLVGYTQTKLGLGKFGLSPKFPTIVNPSLGQKREIPVIVLTNLYSMSAAEMTPIALRHLPQCYVVGERTYGALGGLVRDESEDKGYTITAANMLFEDVDGTNYEGHGVEPDVECLFDKDQWNNGIDNQLEMAISVALSKIAENGNK